MTCELDAHRERTDRRGSYCGEVDLAVFCWRRDFFPNVHHRSNTDMESHPRHIDFPHFWKVLPPTINDKKVKNFEEVCLRSKIQGGGLPHRRFGDSQFLAIVRMALNAYEQRRLEPHERYMDKPAPNFIMRTTPRIHAGNFLKMAIEGFVSVSSFLLFCEIH